MKKLALILLLSAAPSALAQDVPSPSSASSAPPSAPATAPGTFAEIKLTDGRVLKDARVKETLPYGLRISHSEGGGVILADLLPSEIRKQYKLNSEEADKAVLSYKQKVATDKDKAVTAMINQQKKDADTKSKAKERKDKENKPKISKLKKDLEYALFNKNLAEGHVTDFRKRSVGGTSLDEAEKELAKYTAEVESLEGQIKALEQ